MSQGSLSLKSRTEAEKVASSMTDSRNRTGMLIAFEGLDQSGKKTLSCLLESRLIELDRPAKRISFPDYSTPIGREIMLYLMKDREYSPETRHLLFAANRWEWKDRIEAWLSTGQTVIVDRYTGSGLAYGIAHGLELSWLENLEKGLPVPERTFVIDIPVEVSFARKSQNRDAYEGQTELLSKVREIYMDLSTRYGWVVLDGCRESHDLLQEILGVVLGTRIDSHPE